MDRPREASLFGGSVPPSPTPPLALSDLLAQRPFPAYTPPYGRHVVTPDGPELPDDHSAQVVASGNETQASPDHQERQELLVPVAAPQPETQEEPVRVSASITDWQAKRNQLRPSKNQGSKADWIRGWSEGVGVHGCETYCACSESSSAGDLPIPSRETESKSGVRAILRVKRAVSNNTNGATLPITSVSAVSVCHHCGRVTSPPNSAPASLKDEKMDLPPPKNTLASRLNGLIQRVRRKHIPDYGSDPSAPTPGTVGGRHTVAVFRRTRDRQPKHERKVRQPGDSSSSSTSTSNSGKPGSAAAVKKREDRLRRAQELLQRSEQPQDTRVPAHE
ncbi:hypothetical protein QBC34DRAFT_186538 [Podospora aff. communis PSN243]|uniref:Developmental regulatory protein wetA n=1 Tax=Podospora aff. communis PSN243 TaxID=3040156 RepID=A0AAV9GAK3_9PEZI|nr:hypothetical protein QBC34DRAFT_186538 [Podospora aff. communis PSN243]